MKELSIEYTQYTHMDTAGAMAYSGAEIYRQIKELTFSQGDAWHYGASGERVRLSEWAGRRTVQGQSPRAETSGGFERHLALGQ